MNTYFLFLSCIVFSFTSAFLPFASNSQTVGLIQHTPQSFDNGYVLFAPTGSTTTYLIDKCGKLINSWNSAYRTGHTAHLLNDGSLLRAGFISNPLFLTGGQGGIIEKFDWNGNLTWSYRISDSLKCQHHDIFPLPNGNILAIVWDGKTKLQAFEQGRDSSVTPDFFFSEMIVEIQPSGNNGATIVWQWRVWDHLIQNFDSTKPNFGLVQNNPQRINANFMANSTTRSWLHCNGLDYNQDLDQILLSSNSFNELWIIDHSTTTTQAASSNGGNSGKGGDLLYRWGNPLAYNFGTISDKKLFRQHNPRWIPKSFPYANSIMVFNNGLGRPGGEYSTVEIFTPPTTGYTYNSNLPIQPDTSFTAYNKGNTHNFYAQNLSSAQLLSNGNFLLCHGPKGEFTEVDSFGTLVWKYVNPSTGLGILKQDSVPINNSAFRCTFYPADFAGFSGKSMIPRSIIEDVNPLSSSCIITTDVHDTEQTTDNGFNIFPNPASNSITISFQDSHEHALRIEIFNSVGQRVYLDSNIDLTNTYHVALGQFSQGIYTVQISTELSTIRKSFIIFQ